MKLFFLLTAIALGFFGCESRTSESTSIVESEENILGDMESSEYMEDYDVPHELIGYLINTLPDPMETSMIIKSSNAPLDEALLHDAKDYKKYDMTSSKLLNMGVYVTDLGYLLVYDEKSLSLRYAQSLQRLALDLKLSNYIDGDLMEKWLNDGQPIDSLMRITNIQLMQANKELQSTGRGKQSFLIFLGGWIEGMYLTLNTQMNHPDKLLAQQLAEQKETVNRLSMLIDFYRSDKSLSEINTQIQKLAKLYDKVHVEEVVGDLSEETHDGHNLYVQSYTKRSTLPEEDLDEMMEILNITRAAITK